jgi:hypothetical protein
VALLPADKVFKVPDKVSHVAVVPPVGQAFAAIQEKKLHISTNVMKSSLSHLTLSSMMPEPHLTSPAALCMTPKACANSCAKMRAK